MTQAMLKSQVFMQLESVTNIFVKAAIAKTEIDAIPDIFGALYRVRNGMELLGTFYENLDGKWIAQPCNRPEFRPVLNTSDQAHLVIVASWLQD